MLIPAFAIFCFSFTIIASVLAMQSTSSVCACASCEIRTDNARKCDVCDKMYCDDIECDRKLQQCSDCKFTHCTCRETSSCDSCGSNDLICGECISECVYCDEFVCKQCYMPEYERCMDCFKNLCTQQRVEELLSRIMENEKEIKTLSGRIREQDKLIELLLKKLHKQPAERQR